jgi:hypothetical protein
MPEQRSGAAAGPDPADARLGVDPRGQGGEVAPGQGAAAVEDGGGALQRDGGQQVVDHADADGAVVAVDGQLADQAGRGDGPAQAQAGQGEGLGHRARADAAVIEVGDGHGRAGVGLVDAAVDLVAEQPGARAVADGRDGAWSA